MAADFSVIALIAAYNEADIIEQVVSDLIAQGIQVYLLDDGSTDGMAAAVEPYVGRGVVAIERLGGATAGFEPEGPDRFDWEQILRRKTELATELDAAWFIHHDADEFRESPWSHLSLSDAIRHVDALGYNAIDFAGLDFWPVHDGFRAGDDVRAAFTFCSELAPHDLPQVRCWKKTDSLDLASSGGHDACFTGRRVFPLRFVLRHYPVRGQAHGDRKVFGERRNRFLDRERNRGWHVQYDQLQEGVSFLRDPATLARYDPDAFRRSLTLHPRYPEDLEDALRAARSEISATRSEADGLRRENERASAHIEHVTAQLGQIREELCNRETEAALFRSGLEQRTAELAKTRAKMQAELDNRDAEIARANQALDQRDADSERWRTAVDSLTRRLDDLQRSLSWRWTAPARTAYRVFKRP